MKYPFVFVLAIVVSLPSCNNDNCSKNVGFNLSYHLFKDVRINGKTYCKLVNQSLEGDLTAVRELSSVKVLDGASYEHGAVLIEVIDKISEKNYLEAIKNFSEKEKKYIYYSILSAGLEFTQNPKYEKRDIESVFPILSKNIKDL